MQISTTKSLVFHNANTSRCGSWIFPVREITSHTRPLNPIDVQDTENPKKQTEEISHSYMKNVVIINSSDLESNYDCCCLSDRCTEHIHFEKSTDKLTPGTNGRGLSVGESLPHSGRKRTRGNNSNDRRVANNMENNWNRINPNFRLNWKSSRKPRSKWNQNHNNKKWQKNMYIMELWIAKTATNSCLFGMHTFWSKLFILLFFCDSEARQDRPSSWLRLFFILRT